MRLAFIDTAAEVYQKAEADWLWADRQALVTAGFAVTDYTLTGKTQSSLEIELTEFEVLFLSGGNSFYLLEKARKSGFVDLIQNDFFKNQIYVGSSAGSIILGQDLDPIKFIDDPGKSDLTDFQGIGIIDTTIFPHWGNPKFAAKYQKTIDYLYENSLTGILLADNQYLFLSSSASRLELLP